MTPLLWMLAGAVALVVLFVVGVIVVSILWPSLWWGR